MPVGGFCFANSGFTKIVGFEGLSRSLSSQVGTESAFGFVERLFGKQPAAFRLVVRILYLFGKSSDARSDGRCDLFRVVWLVFPLCAGLEQLRVGDLQIRRPGCLRSAVR